MPAPLCFLDTETTGIHPQREVWEIAMIRREPDGSEEEIQFFVDVDLSKADPFGLSIGRFYERHPQGRIMANMPYEAGEYPPVKYTDDAVHQVLRFTHGAHIVGAVPSFDTISLDKMVRREQYIPAWHYHLIDVENLAVGYLAGQRTDGRELRKEAGDLTPPWNSEKLGIAVGVPPQHPTDRHTALGDARWAKAMYDAVMG